MALVPCPSCRRHVRASDEVCPFCTARRRAVSAAVAATLAIAGCEMVRPGAVYGGPPPTTAPASDRAPAPVYGGPPPTAPSASPAVSSPSPSPPAASPSPRIPAAVYGGPPPTTKRR